MFLSFQSPLLAFLLVFAAAAGAQTEQQYVNEFKVSTVLQNLLGRPTRRPINCGEIVVFGSG